jgi:hypothetical protein
MIAGALAFTQPEDTFRLLENKPSPLNALSKTDLPAIPFHIFSSEHFFDIGGINVGCCSP